MSAQPELGERLRALRRERGLSLAQVAQDTSISQSFLSLVETGRTDITIGRLIRLVAFYGRAPVRPPATVTGPGSDRGSRRRRAARPSPAEGIDVYLLTSETDGRMMMPVVAIFEPGGGLAEYSEHDGEEFVHVLRRVDPGGDRGSRADHPAEARHRALPRQPTAHLQEPGEEQSDRAGRGHTADPVGPRAVVLATGRIEGLLFEPVVRDVLRDLLGSGSAAGRPRGGSSSSSSSLIARPTSSSSRAPRGPERCRYV